MFKIFQGANGKIIIVGLLILIMLIPMSMIKSLVNERESRKAEATAEVTSKWGTEQIISGPIITIPYRTFYKDDKGEMRESWQYKHFLPETLQTDGNMNTQIRQRGMYEVVLYNTDVEIKGNFSKTIFDKFNVPDGDIAWSDATMSMGISDMRGIKENIGVVFAGNKLEPEPGLQTKDIIDSGVQVNDIKLKSAQNLDFKFTLNLKGSDAIYFTPLAKSNKVNMTSDWPSPSFTGAFLPKLHKIDDNGFTANWSVLHLNRNYPQSWDGNQFSIDKSHYGVSFYIAADVYQQSMRIVKYALLFIVFTFMAFFCIEILHGNRVHPFQYLLIGLAVSVFYILLISLSEQINFDSAYIIASLAIISMIGFYTKSIFQQSRLAFLISGVLALLYVYIYCLLQLEDYALLIGSIGLFVGLAVLMYVTRKVDWYNIQSNNSE